MKQKLALCCALIHKPMALFLDEPTTGVDAVSRTEFWDNLIQIRDNGIPIVVSTPYMDEATRCDRVAMIHNGRIMKIDTPKNIINGYSGMILAVTSKDRQKPKVLLQGFSAVESLYSFGDALHISLKQTDSVTIKLLKAKLEQGMDSPYQITQIEPSFEDCFLQLMGESENGQ
ncbi:MAG: ABC transporter ATP-binding protein, partial [Candidatus Cloacimonetes bacterium]|nr:ABC transporter ATP-binding protein [Candidatus Cloacimonadota bacterium]